jgi:hypothetical protein
VRIRAAVLVLLVALVGAPPRLLPPASSDESPGKADYDQGMKALAAKAWAEAKAHFQDALTKDPNLLESRIGTAEATIGAGDTPTGLALLRAFLLSCQRGIPLPEERFALFAQARARVIELDPLEAKLEAILNDHADELVAIASRAMTKDPAAADRALRAALHMVPDHRKANDLIKSLAKAGSGKAIPLFTGTDTDAWIGWKGGGWVIEDGAMVGTSKGEPIQARNARTFDGDFDVIVEARLLEATPTPGIPTFFGVLVPWADDTHTYQFGCITKSIFLHEFVGAQPADDHNIFTQPFASRPKKPDPSQWVRYELRFRGDSLLAFVNDEQVFRGPRSKTNRQGILVVQVQNCKAAFRRVEIVPR